MAHLREHRWVRRLLAWNAYVGCLASGKRGRTWDYSTKAWKSASGALQSFKVIDHFYRYEASLLKTTCVMHFFLSPPMLKMESPFLLRDFDHESPLFWLPPDFTAPNICFSPFFFLHQFLDHFFSQCLRYKNKNLTTPSPNRPSPELPVFGIGPSVFGPGPEPFLPCKDMSCRH